MILIKSISASISNLFSSRRYGMLKILTRYQYIYFSHFLITFCIIVIFNRVRSIQRAPRVIYLKDMSHYGHEAQGADIHLLSFTPWWNSNRQAVVVLELTSAYSQGLDLAATFETLPDWKNYDAVECHCRFVNRCRGSDLCDHTCSRNTHGDVVVLSVSCLPDSLG